MLIFCHADTRLPQGYDDIIRTALEEPEVLMTGEEIATLNALIKRICYTCNFGLVHSQAITQTKKNDNGYPCLAFSFGIEREAGVGRPDFDFVERGGSALCPSVPWF